MTNEFDLFANSDDVVESGDVMPSDNFGTQDTGLYKMGVKLAYMGESGAGAKNINFEFQSADGTGPLLKQTIYLTSKKETGNRTTYFDKNKVEHKLPGIEQVDNLCEMLTGHKLQELGKATGEKKTIKLWNFEEKAELNTEVTMVMGLIDKPVLIGLHKIKENKVKLIEGKWVDQAEVKWSNEVDKFFEADSGLTHAEKKAKVTDPAWLKKWKEKFVKTPPWIRDKYKEVAASDIDTDFAAADGGTDTDVLFP
jgi:hypothetical protein